jgi:MoxR-like ATPase
MASPQTLIDDFARMPTPYALRFLLDRWDQFDHVELIHHMDEVRVRATSGGRCSTRAIDVRETCLRDDVRESLDRIAAKSREPWVRLPMYHYQDMAMRELMSRELDRNIKLAIQGERLGIDFEKLEKPKPEKPKEPNPFDDPSPNNPQEEAIMGFSKKKRALPESVKDLDFTDLNGAHRRTLADWMGVRAACHRAYEDGGLEAASKLLADACARDWERAQQGYEIICLGKQNAGMKKEMTESDVVKALYSTVSEIINEHKDGINGLAVDEVGKAVRAQLKELEKYAKDAIDRAADRKAPIIIKSEGKTKKVKGVLPPEFERMIQLASARIPIMLVGPAGCGKTYLCEKLAEALDMEFSDQSCSEGMSESVFNGLLLPIDKGGAFRHVSTPFMERYEGGGVMLLDEIDAGDPNLFTYINKAIANSSYTVPQRWTKPVVKKHKDFVLVAAANTFGHGADSMYVGRNQLDAATLDRFKVGLITMDYNRDVEQSLAPQELCEWAWNLRDKIRVNKLRRVMSTRVIQNLGRMTDQYKWGQKEWESAYFTGWSDADRRLVA